MQGGRGGAGRPARRGDRGARQGGRAGPGGGGCGTPRWDSRGSPLSGERASPICGAAASSHDNADVPRNEGARPQAPQPRGGRAPRRTPAGRCQCPGSRSTPAFDDRGCRAGDSARHSRSAPRPPGDRVDLDAFGLRKTPQKPRGWRGWPLPGPGPLPEKWHTPVPWRVSDGPWPPGPTAGFQRS